MIPNAVSKELCDRMTGELYDRAERLMGVTRSNPASWNVRSPPSPCLSLQATKVTLVGVWTASFFVLCSAFFVLRYIFAVDRRVQEIDPIGFIDVWHGDTYNELRQSPVLYSIFAQLLKTHRLVTTIDRYLTYAHAQSQCHKELQLPP